MDQHFSEDCFKDNNTTVLSLVAEPTRNVVDTVDNNQSTKHFSNVGIDACDCASLLFSLLGSFVHDRDFLFGKDPNDIFNTIEQNEEAIFSPIPYYLLNQWTKLKGEGNGVKKLSKPKNCIGSGNDNPYHARVERGVGRKSVINPSVPLLLPFKRRCNDFSSLKNGKPGTYHELFFGDVNNVTFPTNDTKRRELEKRWVTQEALKKKLYQSVKPEYKFTPRLRKVPKDFVPSCASVTCFSAPNESKKVHENKRNATKYKNTGTPKTIVSS